MKILQSWDIGLLFGSFPAVFKRVLSVLYLPASLLFVGLLMRVIAI